MRQYSRKFCASFVFLTHILCSSNSRADWLPDGIARIAIKNMTDGERISTAKKFGDSVVAIGETAKTPQSFVDLARLRMKGVATFESGSIQKAGEDVVTSGCGFFNLTCSIRDGAARTGGAGGEIVNQQNLSQQIATGSGSNYERDQAWIAHAQENENRLEAIRAKAREKLPDRTVDIVVGQVKGGGLIQAALESISEWGTMFASGKQGAVWNMSSLAPTSDGEIKNAPAPPRTIDQVPRGSVYMYDPSESVDYQSRDSGDFTSSQPTPPPRSNSRSSARSDRNSGGGDPCALDVAAENPLPPSVCRAMRGWR